MSKRDKGPTSPGIMSVAGGPWGSQDEDIGNRGDTGGPRNPWTPPRDDQGRATDRGVNGFDDLLRRARDGLGGGPGLPGAPSRPIPAFIWWGAATLAVLILLGTTSIHSIGEKQRGVVTRLGRYVRTLEPGMNYSWPEPLEHVEVIASSEIRILNLGSSDDREEQLVLTGDQNLIDLSYSVRWDVSNPRQFAFQMDKPEDAIAQVAESVMRGVMATVSLGDAMVSGRTRIEMQVQQRMQAILDQYGVGVRIRGVAIAKADPPNAVLNAFKEVTAAQQAFDSDINSANAYAQQTAADAQGKAAAFDKIYEQYRLAPEVTRQRLYYEAMEAVLSGVNKTVVETNGVTPYLPLPQMAAPRPATDRTSENNIVITGRSKVK